ncbi:MAG: hypothetical protein RR854_00040 [Muribaculaceae bacterium]
MGDPEKLTFPLRGIIGDLKSTGYLLREIRHRTICNPHKRKKNNQYSKPHKSNYPYWKGYQFDNGMFNVVKFKLEEIKLLW